MFMFGYRLVYFDGKLLKSEEHNLSGRPDMIYKRFWGRALIPVELKSGESDYPRQGDLMQLAAYFIIIEEAFGIRPRKGRLIYRNTMFIIRNTKKLRKELLAIADIMNDALEGDIRFQPEPSFVNCRYCRCRGTVCEFCD